jgi:hypothetical protein
MNWEKIGSDGYLGSDLDRVPRWVRNQLKRLDYHDLRNQAYDEGKFVILKGRHYEYLLEPVGQGNYIEILRRRRSGR